MKLPDEIGDRVLVDTSTVQNDATVSTTVRKMTTP